MNCSELDGEDEISLHIRVWIYCTVSSTMDKLPFGLVVIPKDIIVKPGVVRMPGKRAGHYGA
ncbi:MAG: hypothetical protein QXP38_04480 [Nitrososphaerota archaeon]